MNDINEWLQATAKTCFSRLTVFVAAYVPARPAMRIEPISALRAE